MVDSDDMRLAAEWLDCNEGSGGEMEACSRVAEWLRKQAINKEIRKVANETGIPVSRIRNAMKNRQ